LRRDGARCRVENILRACAFALARLACDKVGNSGCAHKQSFKKISNRSAKGFTWARDKREFSLASEKPLGYRPPVTSKLAPVT
jgi:hypothetical protein